MNIVNRLKIVKEPGRMIVVLDDENGFSEVFCPCHTNIPCSSTYAKFDIFFDADDTCSGDHDILVIVPDVPPEDDDCDKRDIPIDSFEQACDEFEGRERGE